MLDLTYKERLNLVFQCRILEALYPSEADHYKNFRTALENGYTYNYNWFTEYISEEEISVEDCKQVWATLEMYEALLRSYEELPEPDKALVNRYSIGMHGYDGNNEPEYLGYVRFIIHDMKRYERVKEYSQGDDFNSHMPMMDIYSGMLLRFKEISRDDRYKMSVEQINSIVRH